MHLVLASASPRRKHLLEEMGLRFVVEPAHADEWEEGDADPESLVLHNAGLKAETVARRHPGFPVLAADSAVAVDGIVLNKPVDLADARRMLKTLSGRTHTVFTGVCLIFGERNLSESFFVTSDVTFQDLGEARIDRYFEIVDPLDKAGAYGIQEGAELIIAGLEGSFSNVMGLPVEATEALLERFALLETLKLE